MKERGILFKGHLVKKIQAGLKGQTRRVIRPQPGRDVVSIEPGWMDLAYGFMGHFREFKCPYGGPGDRLWVRECFCAHWCGADPDICLPPGHRRITEGKTKQSDGNYATISESNSLFVYYRADHEEKPMHHSKWKPSIHMPRWASRLTLEITGVRVEQIQDISEEDAQAEGIAPIYQPAFVTHGEVQGPDEISALDIFPDSWDAINKKRGFGWDVNPWVWVIEFEDITKQ